MSDQDRAMFSAGSDDFDAFDASEDEGGLPGLFVLLLGLVVLATFGGVVYVAYQQGVKHGERTVQDGGAGPARYAQAEPLRGEAEANPAAAGGEAPEVFDRIAERDPSREQALSAPPEEPVNREAADTASDDVIVQALASRAERERQAAQRQAEAASAQANVPAPQPAQSQARAPQPSVPAPPSAAPAPSNAVAIEPEPTPSQPAVTPGSYVVQIASSQNRGDAEANWARLQTSLGAMVSGLGPDIERADLGSRGVWYRLRVGPFNSRGEADQFCRSLKTRGRDCLVKQA